MRFRTLNPRTAANSVRSDLFTAPAKQPERISLSSSGGEGWGEEAVFSYPGGSWERGRLLERGRFVGKRVGSQRPAKIEMRVSQHSHFGEGEANRRWESLVKLHWLRFTRLGFFGGG